MIYYISYIIYDISYIIYHISYSEKQGFAYPVARGTKWQSDKITDSNRLFRSPPLHRCGRFCVIPSTLPLSNHNRILIAYPYKAYPLLEASHSWFFILLLFQFYNPSFSGLEGILFLGYRTRLQRDTTSDLIRTTIYKTVERWNATHVFS